MIKEIRNEYMTGKLDKNQYQMKMFEKYRSLWDYSDIFEKDSMVKAIHIKADGVTITINNKSANGLEYCFDMVVDKTDWRAVPIMAMNFGSYELEEIDAVNRICHWISNKFESSLILDVGANLGLYTLNVCSQYKNIRSYAFEPVKETYERLRKNVEINGLDNCVLFNMGLSDATKEDIIFFNPEESGAASMANIRENENAQKIRCRFTTLNEFALKHDCDSLEFLKCDVEGAELFVFRGGKEIIQKYRPIVFSEMLRKWSAKFNYHPNEIIDFFKQLGYECYVIVQDGLERFDRVDEDTIQTNYFFMHSEKHKEIISLLCK